MLNLDRIDSSPIVNSDFDYQFLQWIWVLVDTLNENFSDIENSFSFLTAMNYTASEITTLDTDGNLSDGVLIYDTTNNVYVGRSNGVLVKFTTTVWP